MPWPGCCGRQSDVITAEPLLDDGSIHDQSALLLNTRSDGIEGDSAPDRGKKRVPAGSISQQITTMFSRSAKPPTSGHGQASSSDDADDFNRPEGARMMMEQLETVDEVKSSEKADGAKTTPADFPSFNEDFLFGSNEKKSEPSTLKRPSEGADIPPGKGPSPGMDETDDIEDGDSDDPKHSGSDHEQQLDEVKPPRRKNSSNSRSETSSRRDPSKRGSRPHKSGDRKERASRGSRSPSRNAGGQTSRRRGGPRENKGSRQTHSPAGSPRSRQPDDGTSPKRQQRSNSAKRDGRQKSGRRQGRSHGGGDKGSKGSRDRRGDLDDSPLE